ncbi:hypothetical protein BCR34DRAFT_585876 [Clohesyomyces aquaticus]|uniref:Uncharacterized protein n=1 Tax=Clohesyomyces aquaticus TaxID=1231657 RepID=A0A1Y1ZVH1_9PLEO|nr:hypothetical protein BCR34DRAFT_585876 [Clohesyomyces aquaticus]
MSGSGPAAHAGSNVGGAVRKGVGLVHGAGEAIRGNINAAVDSAAGDRQGTVKNEAIASRGVDEMEHGHYHSTGAGVTPVDTDQERQKRTAQGVDPSIGSDHSHHITMCRKDFIGFLPANGPDHRGARFDGASAQPTHFGPYIASMASGHASVESDRDHQGGDHSVSDLGSNDPRFTDSGTNDSIYYNSPSNIGGGHPNLRYDSGHLPTTELPDPTATSTSSRLNGPLNSNHGAEPRAASEYDIIGSSTRGHVQQELQRRGVTTELEQAFDLDKNYAETYGEPQSSFPRRDTEPYSNTAGDRKYSFSRRQTHDDAYELDDRRMSHGHAPHASKFLNLLDPRVDRNAPSGQQQTCLNGR